VCEFKCCVCVCVVWVCGCVGVWVCVFVIILTPNVKKLGIQVGGGNNNKKEEVTVTKGGRKVSNIKETFEERACLTVTVERPFVPTHGCHACIHESPRKESFVILTTIVKIRVAKPIDLY
jgi:hypothetical protein